MRVELLHGAEADLLEAYIWFEDQRTGVGEHFYRILDFALERLGQHPEIGPVYRGAYRRLVLRPFGFGVFYTIIGERLIVGAILNLRKNPESIARRLFP
jgi:plasmid stabilization system protein ParE